MIHSYNYVTGYKHYISLSYDDEKNEYKFYNKPVKPHVAGEDKYIGWLYKMRTLTGSDSVYVCFDDVDIDGSHSASVVLSLNTGSPVSAYLNIQWIGDFGVSFLYAKRVIENMGVFRDSDMVTSMNLFNLGIAKAFCDNHNFCHEFVRRLYLEIERIQKVYDRSR